MLPGFRFLVAAIIFSLSLLVFGLGAAALLRAAHEQFASNSAWRAAPETSYTAFLPQAEPPRPVLAMLQVEPNTPPQGAESSPDLNVKAISDAPMAAVESTAAQAASTSAKVDAPAAETPKPDATVATLAVSSSDDPGPSGATEAKSTDAATPAPTAPRPAETTEAKSDSPVTAPGADAASVTASAAADWIGNAAPTETKALDTKALDTKTSASTNMTVAAPASNLIAPAMPKPDPRTVKIASLGEQPIASEKKASVRIASIQLHRSLMKKRLAQARHAKQKRLMAERAQAARQAALIQQRQLEQQLADPFGLQQLPVEQTAVQRQAGAQQPRR